MMDEFKDRDSEGKERQNGRKHVTTIDHLDRTKQEARCFPNLNKLQDTEGPFYKVIITHEELKDKIQEAQEKERLDELGELIFYKKAEESIQTFAYNFE